MTRLSVQQNKHFDVLCDLRHDLAKHIDPVYRAGCQRFFKETVHVIGVRTPVVRRIARDRIKIIKSLHKKEVWHLVEELLARGKCEEATVGLQWAAARHDIVASDMIVFERWIKKYVTNWATCDDLCGHVTGPLIVRFPDIVARLSAWSRSSNQWLRRAAAVSLIVGLRRGLFLKEAFRIAETLLLDKEDLVQKGYGWMLKEASHAFPKEVLAFVMARRGYMPRTALRYAIEKYPAGVRAKALLRSTVLLNDH